MGGTVLVSRRRRTELVAGGANTAEQKMGVCSVTLSNRPLAAYRPSPRQWVMEGRQVVAAWTVAAVMAWSVSSSWDDGEE